MDTKSVLTPKVMLPGSPLKPLDGEYSSFNILSKEKICKLLLNRETDIATKIRCLFFGRFHGDEESAELLIKSLDYSESVLFRHEVLYVLGQMGLRTPLKRLYEILGDLNEHPMVRHEAGEAIAAIGDIESLKIIEKYIKDESPAVRETCLLASYSLNAKKEKIKNFQDINSKKSSSGENLVNLDINAFNTRDPTPPNSCKLSEIENLASELLDEALPLNKRYGALFALRNILTGIIDYNQKSNLNNNSTQFNNDKIYFIANKISHAMEFDTKSAVFRHECAFVLGQIQVISTADSLSRVISNVKEESMVRHEAAFALGSVGSSDPRYCGNLGIFDKIYNKEEIIRVRKLAIETLETYSKDKDIIVAESCIVGLQTIFDETGSLDPIIIVS